MATFCWLPPDKVADGLAWRAAFDRQRLIHGSAARSCRLGKHQAKRSEPAKLRKRDIVADAQPQRQAFGFAVLADQTHRPGSSCFADWPIRQ